MFLLDKPNEFMLNSVVKPIKITFFNIFAFVKPSKGK